MPSDAPVLLIAGPVCEEFFLLPDGKIGFGVLGGPALYAAAGAGVWSPDGIGVVSRVGKNFTPELLRRIEQSGLDIAGIRLFPGHPPALGFHYYETWEKHIDWDPVKYFSKQNIPCPSALLEYTPPSFGEGSILQFPETAIRNDDLPAHYRQARAVYIAPCHYQSQITLAVSLRQSGIGPILLSPPEGLLLPSYRSQIREILHGIDILFAREEPMAAFAGGTVSRNDSIPEYLASWGPKIVILQKDFRGVQLYDAESRRSRFVSFYPAEMKNPLAIGDSFCGGFLSAWRKSFDPLESTLVGCVSASLSMEGLGGLYALHRIPGLAEARLTSLRRSLNA
jgi:sugar/nucleoside kinase (ribokinase family)